MFAIDLDGDGDVDVLSASLKKNKIEWYENGGSGARWSTQTIYSGGSGARAVCAIDVDGNGDNDVITGSYNDYTVAWLENNGAASGWSYHEITTNADPVQDGAVAIDLDGDGDVDVVTAASLGNTIAWHENDGGSGDSWNYHVIYTAAGGARGVFAIDVDGDGDIDVVSGAQTSGVIAWHENDGGIGANWNYHLIYDYGTSSTGIFAVFAIDVDGDGDIDALSVCNGENTIAWYENLDGSGRSWSYHAINTGASGAYGLFAIDLDARWRRRRRRALGQQWGRHDRVVRHLSCGGDAMGTCAKRVEAAPGANDIPGLSRYDNGGLY